MAGGRSQRERSAAHEVCGMASRGAAGRSRGAKDNPRDASDRPARGADRARASRAALRASGRSRRRRLLPRAARPRRARSPRCSPTACSRCCRKLPLWRHLASSANGGRGEIERRLALLVWQGNAGVLNAALDEREREWLARCRAFDLGALARAPAPQPARLARRAAAGAPRRRVLGLGRRDRHAGAARPARQRAQGRPRRGARAPARAPASTPRRRRIRRSASASPASPRCRRPTSSSRAWSRCRTKAASCSRCSPVRRRGEMVVDFCAGAGGKTLALGAQMRNTGRLYAFDVSGHRLAALKPRLARSGLPTCIRRRSRTSATIASSAWPARSTASWSTRRAAGSGTLRRNPDLKWRQSAESVAALRADAGGDPRRRGAPGEAGRPARLCDLQRARSGRRGRWRANSTPRAATQFARVPAAEALQRAHVADAGTLVSGAELRLWTHRHATDGFFAALWERR